MSHSKAILTDQLRAVRETVLISIPINIVLGLSVVLVAWNSNEESMALIWFGLSSLVNALRILLCKYPFPKEDLAQVRKGLLRTVAMHLRMHWILALASGTVWAFISVLCDGYQTPQTLFYLTVVCGITAGAVTHGSAYALIPICFISPPLLAVIGCLVYVGGFDRYCLAATVGLYHASLIRGAWVCQAQVKNESRLKHEATSLSASLEIANRQIGDDANRMQHRAIHDDLTGLLNRRGFLEEVTLPAPLEPACTLLLLDLDGFKPVNDTLGHAVGDQVLIEVARRLERTAASGSIVARLGGDEFAIFLRETSPPGAKELARTMIEAISEPFDGFGSVHVGCSIGVYCGTHIGASEMLLSADAALYSAKSEGRNRWRLYDEQLHLAEEIRRDVERDLPAALASGAVSLWYQPIMADYGNSLDSFEALIRWRHPKHGWIAPQTIIRSAAVTGLGEPLFLKLLSDVIDAIKALEAHGFDHVRVAMNVSPPEMVQITIDDLVLARLHEAGISPSSLELEITEESAINLVAIREKLARLCAAGTTIAIDDFGTGYSSLGSLQQLRAHRVKIDKAFVRGIASSPAKSVLVEAVLRISGSFEFEVVAEGVETQEDLDRLKELGCSTMQGYLFARPMPLAEALVWAAGARLGRGEMA